ncbi:hypothetical protein EON82_07775 [bacterium]|nr:MAG: hypothetical protein EON82_07775 [bacterium]
MAENPKGFVSFAILVLSAFYVVSLVPRSRTRYRASCVECLIFGTLLFLALILGPAYIIAFRMAR